MMFWAQMDLFCMTAHIQIEGVICHSEYVNSVANVMHFKRSCDTLLENSMIQDDIPDDPGP